MNAAAVAAAVEAIDLKTYDGEDPCLIHEPSCQNCHAKKSESETQFRRCAGGCSVIWYCSDACMAHFLQHSMFCDNIVRCKTNIEAMEQELRDQHHITDPYVTGRSIPRAAERVHWDLSQAVRSMSNCTFAMACEGETKELWEMVLDSYKKLFRMSEPQRGHLLTARNNASVLIRLDRLEDAWRFIRNTMVTYNSNARTQVVIDYETEDRYTDCLGWVRSSYPLRTDDEYVRKCFHQLILGLIIIKLRIRVAAARNAWKDTINEVFLKTKNGKQLDEAKSVLEEYFSIWDDTFQLEQILQLMGILHFFDSSMIPNIVKTEPPYRETVLENAFTCLHRTPNGPHLLSRELDSEGFEDWVTSYEPLVAAHKNMRAWKARMGELWKVGTVNLGQALCRYALKRSLLHPAGAAAFATLWTILLLPDHLASTCMAFSEEFCERVNRGKKEIGAAKLESFFCAIGGGTVVGLIEGLTRNWGSLLPLWWCVVPKDVFASKHYMDAVQAWQKFNLWTAIWEE